MKVIPIILILVNQINLLAQQNHVNWLEAENINYNNSFNDKEYFVLFVEKDNALCERLIKKIDNYRRLHKYINEEYLPILIDIEEINFTIKVNNEIYDFADKRTVVGINNRDLQKLSFGNKIEEYVIISIKGIENCFFEKKIFFFSELDEYLTFEEIILWGPCLEEEINLEKEEKHKLSSFTKKFFDNQIPSIIVLNKDQQVRLVLKGYHNPVDILHQLEK